MSTIMRTFTPFWIMPSAIVWNWFLSPCAFWMSYFTLAALNACSRNGRSAVSQRTEDLLSGRITPTYGCFALLLAPLEGELLVDLLQAAMPPNVTTPTVATARIP